MQLPGTRQAAKLAGSMYYFTGKPCSRGHVAVRLTSARRCVECNRAQSNRWRRDNRARYNELCLRAQNEKYRTDPAFREACKVKSHSWFSKNKDRARATSNAWRQRNPGSVAAGKARAKAKRRGAPKGDRKAYGEFVKTARSTTFIPCYYCGLLTTTKNRHIDHKTPLSRGGTDAVENLCVAYAPCNLEKHTMTEAEFKELLCTKNR